MTDDTQTDDTERPDVRRPPVLATPEDVANLAERVALDCVEHADADADEVADRLESVAQEVRDWSVDTETDCGDEEAGER